MFFRLFSTCLLFITSAALPARAETFFEDSSLFSPLVTPAECAAGYALMAAVVGQTDFFEPREGNAERPTAEDYTTRKNILGQVVAEKEGTLEAAEQIVRQSYQTMGHFLSIMIGTHAALELDGFARFVTECDTAFGFEPKSEAYVHFSAGSQDENELESPFNPALYETEASCAAGYQYLADLLAQAGEIGVEDPNHVGEFADNRLTITKPWARAENLRTGADPAAYDAANEIFGRQYAYLFLTGPNKWEFAALADGLTRCDRSYGFAPLTRRMLTAASNDLVRQMGNCLAGFDLAYETNPDGAITAGRTPLQFRESLYQRTGASYYPDLADIAEDQARDFIEALRASPSMMVEEQFRAMVQPCL